MQQHRISWLAFPAVLLVLPSVLRAQPGDFTPPDELNLVLDAPITRWDEAVPLGNGLLGGLLWGEDNLLRLSLDRGDLWDLRVPPVVESDSWNYATIQRLVAQKNQGKLVELFDAPYNMKYPTKIPGGRLEVTLGASRRIERFELDLGDAVGSANVTGGDRIEAFFSATRHVALLRIPGPPPEAWRLVPPAAVRQLGYEKATVGGEDTCRWYVQKAALGLAYAAVAATRRVGDATLLALTISSSRDGTDPAAAGRRAVEDALTTGFEPLLGAHKAWWRRFWSASRVRIPDRAILKHYYLVQYFYGAASRRGSPPIPLQGVWTADAGSLPPWKGDYHHDLNTQMTYAAYQTAGRFEAGACFLDFLWEFLPRFRIFARKFYDAPGAAVPGVMTLDGKPMGGWSMYSLSPTNGAWLGYLFYQHWRYTMDETFLSGRAYPWCAEIGNCLMHLLRPDKDGVLRLPLSSSPEIHNNSLRAWLTPNSNYDHDCMAALFLALEEMANTLGKKKEAGRWRTAADGLGKRAVAPSTGCLMFAPGEEVRPSHRHFSHTMSIHPFGLLTIEGSAEDRAVITASTRLYDKLGTRAWCGYSFSWMACLRARTGEPEAAFHYLDIYQKAFILRNGFHANGDQLKAGYSGFTYRPFTLEGNFLASQAVHEMLCQSWGGTVRVFPATPRRWRDASFDNLRAEGGYRVSARREKGATTYIRIEASRDGVLRLRDNFGGRSVRFNLEGMKKEDGVFRVNLRSGDVLEATLPPPATL